MRWMDGIRAARSLAGPQSPWLGAGHGAAVTGPRGGCGCLESGASGAEGRGWRGERAGPGPAACKPCSSHGSAPRSSKLAPGVAAGL